MSSGWFEKAIGRFGFWILAAFLLIVFLMGGGSRADTQSLVILRPLTFLFLGFGLLGLRQSHVTANKFMFGMAIAILAIVAIQLVPLPPVVWQSLPGRSLASGVDRVAALGALWRPISLVPDGTWNALYALAVPLTTLVYLVQLDRESRFRLLPFIIGIGLFSGLWGLLQAIGPPDGPLYLYKITTTGGAVGLFANRNHQAVFLASLFPMLATYASISAQSQQVATARFWFAVCAGLVLVPLLLVTGSRAGIIAGLIGMAFVPLLYRSPDIRNVARRTVKRINYMPVIGGTTILIVGGMTWLASRAQAFERLLAGDGTDDLRFRIWGPIAGMTGKYFPAGSGFGSFVEVYQIDEPDNLLDMTYLNHAHNDWLEIVMTGGLPGAALLMIGVVAWVVGTRHAFRNSGVRNRERDFAKLGVVIVAIMAMASITDYPLRVPSLSCLFLVAAFWATFASTTQAKNAGSV